MAGAVEKVRSGGSREVAVTERGTFFGYGDLVVDMRNFARLREATGAPVIFDATHSVQQPGQGAGGASGGQREHIPALLAAAAVAGADGFFLETHPDPARALERRRHPVAARPARRADRPHARCLGPRAGMEIDAALDRRPRSGCVALDVDGVLTDNGICIGPMAGRAGRAQALRHPGRTRHACSCAPPAIPVVWLSGRHSEATALRARSSAWTSCSRFPVRSKLRGPGELLERRGHRLGGGRLRRRRSRRSPGPAAGRPAGRGRQRRARGPGGRRVRHHGAGRPRRGARDRGGIAQGAGSMGRHARALLHRAGARWLTRARRSSCGRRVLRLEARGGRGRRRPARRAVRPRGASCSPRRRGRVIVSGVGKSGLVARKIAATLTSTGTPASYLHPVDSPARRSRHRRAATTSRSC